MRPAAFASAQRIGQQQLADLRNIAPAPALQGGQQARIGGFAEQLPKKIQGFTAGHRHRPCSVFGAMHGVQHMAGEEEFQQRRVGKAEGAGISLVAAGEEGRWLSSCRLWIERTISSKRSRSMPGGAWPM